MSRPLSVLLVEDDLDVAEAVVDVLTDAGHTVRHALDGMDGLRLLEHMERPALILLDLMMPRMNGEQFRTAQLADPRFMSIPVVMLSADRALAQKAQVLKVAAYLFKPVTPRQLLQALHEVTTSHL